MITDYNSSRLALKCFCRILRDTSENYSKLELHQARNKLVQNYGYDDWKKACFTLKSAPPSTHWSLLLQLKNEIFKTDQHLVRSEGKYFELRFTEDMEVRTIWRGHVKTGHEIREPWTFGLTPADLSTLRKTEDPNIFLINSRDMLELWLTLGHGKAMLHENVAQKFIPDLLNKANLGLISDSFDHETAKSQAERFEDNYVLYDDLPLILVGRAYSH